MRARHVGSGCLDLWDFHVIQLGGGPSEQEAGLRERVCSQIKHIVIWFLTLTSFAVSSWAKDKDASKKAVLSVLGHMPNLDKPGKLCLADDGGWGEFGSLPCFLYCHPGSGHQWISLHYYISVWTWFLFHRRQSGWIMARWERILIHGKRLDSEGQQNRWFSEWYLIMYETRISVRKPVIPAT